VKPKAIIVDCDGTLCNIDHRIWRIQQNPKDWEGFHSEMHLDPVNENVKRAVKAWAEDHEILFVTGRFEKYKSMTSAWLARNLPETISNYRLYMRKDDDYRKDAEVKQEIYQYQIHPFFDVRLVLDDRKRVVDMWRALGLETWAVASGEY
jgi:FMN phosphatase YigB (HAD superfamily)